MCAKKNEFLSRKHALHTVQRTELLALIFTGITVIMPSESMSYTFISGCLYQVGLSACDLKKFVWG